MVNSLGKVFGARIPKTFCFFRESNYLHFGLVCFQLIDVNNKIILWLSLEIRFPLLGIEGLFTFGPARASK
jgi:hypothetical protein